MTAATWGAIGAALAGALAGFIARQVRNKLLHLPLDTWGTLNFAAGWAISGTMVALLWVR